MRLDLGKCWNVARDGLLICFHEDPTYKSYKHSNSLLCEVLVLLWGPYEYGVGRTHGSFLEPFAVEKL
jgi:hypothetical protein